MKRASLSGARNGLGRLERLVREGLVRPARATAARTVLTSEPPRPTGAVNAVQVLLDERRSGR